ARTLASALVEDLPRLVFMGNSVMESCVDAEQFSELSGVPSLKVTPGGAASALWYLILKNVIAASPHRPELLVLGFRDTFLTEPEFRAIGRYKPAVDAYAGESEPVLDRLAYFPGSSEQEMNLRRNWSLLQRRGDLRLAAEDAAKFGLPSLLLGSERDATAAAVDQVFGADRQDSEQVSRAQLAAAAATRSSPARFDFDARLPDSFLPYFLDEAEAAGIRVVLVRLKNRRDAKTMEGGTPPRWATERLPSYIASLAEYLKERGVPLFDLSTDPRITLELYARGDHLDEAIGRPVFTRVLAETLRDELDRLK
ncbi:MAG: hypothetical protein AAF368_14075, partial [Planctomycetota bacterium]